MNNRKVLSIGIAQNYHTKKDVISRCCCLWDHNPPLFLISVEEISMRNLSAGIETNISFNVSGMSKSSRTCRKAEQTTLTEFPKEENRDEKGYFYGLMVCGNTLKTPSTLRPPTRKVHPILLHPSSISSIFP